MLTQQQCPRLQFPTPSRPLAALQWMTPPSSGLSMASGLVQPIALVGASLLLCVMTYMVFPTNSSMLPTERSSPHTACLLGPYEPMDLPHHRVPLSGLRLPPLSVQGGACPLLTTPVGPCIQQ